ncbi:AAA family ATPase [Bermanella marisrubri]|uniref:endopeptidase La n=1 Tax=Bermanella marisrubri TaxID=207949 RepID=Q1N6G5_9GAMM|nr:AAA family ATPase [Bermanella marisrubri]EAT13627.1 ATP-dependent protease, putative [Oceanobacter sp. RED65] [Bermanella marisrubri]QIZ84413.1 AAA family ATPase [Bermanella marisrubri]
MSRQTHTPLPVDELSIHIPEQALPFKTSDELSAFNGVLGQDRAVSAIQFGVAMNRPGYNVYVMGDSGTGRSSYVTEYLKSEAKRQESPSDWAYVNNFDNNREPKKLELSAGQGQKFKKDMEELVDQLLTTFPAAFEHPTYQQKKSLIDREFNHKYDRVIDGIEQAALKRNIAMYRDATSISFLPMKEGKAMEETEFAQLSEEERETFHENIHELEAQLNDALVPLPQWKRESTETLKKLNQDTINESVEPLFHPLEEKYQDLKDVLEYLKQMKHNLHRTVISELTEDRLLESREDSAKRLFLEETYVPNLIVSRSADAGAPVVYESHPNYANLFGRIEYTSEQGALVTHYRKICPGALHRANGGYLIVDAEKLLYEPFVWDALKRALSSRELKIESPYSEMGIISTTTLIPELIELDVKIILIGSRSTYYLLQDLDDDFNEMFRVLVDFDDHLPRSEEHMLAFARLLQSRCEEKGYAAIENLGVQRLIEHSARLAEDKRHLSARIGDLFELLAEAEFIRDMAKDKYINAQHISRALDAKEQRSGRIQKEIQDDIIDGTILIDTDGEAIGKINGLTVLSIGDSSFGAPARISATVYPGGRGIVDIEREANLGQNIHTKGVMILTGYLGHTYAQEFPLEVSASIAMEQSYGHVDGDSASLAEACALISALAHVPIHQSLAVTGSLSQYGEVQAVGGINEKIEGFFSICKARGLNGKQGVLIPASNVKHLVLKREVCDAVEAGEFHIYGIANIDQALEILMDKKAGQINKKGRFPRGSINYKVLERLRDIADIGKDEDHDDSDAKSRTDAQT